MNATLIIPAALLILAFGYAISLYNSLVRKRQRCLNALSQIDVQLKRRRDLIPNLIHAVKGYMAHEKETLSSLARARETASAAAGAAMAAPGAAAPLAELAGAESALSLGLGRLLARVEAYPELKAGQNMLALQEELSSTENKVGFARQAYNDAAQAYNTAREFFPAALAAGPLGFHRFEFLSFEGVEFKQLPKVDF